MTQTMRMTVPLANQILAEYGGPGGGARYESKEAADRARKRYLKAYAYLYSRTTNAKAAGRANDNSLSRRNAHKMRRHRPAGVTAWYQNLLTAEHVKCFYCDRELPTEERVGDHFVPLSKGGEHCVENLVPACRSCNQEKSDKMPGDYIAECYLRRV